MKNSKKINFGLLGLILGLGLVFTQSAFKSAKAPVQYQYISNSHLPADIKDINNWQAVSSNSPACGEGDEVVCRYTYDGNTAAFSSFLSQSSTTPTLLRSNADATKE